MLNNNERNAILQLLHNKKIALSQLPEDDYLKIYSNPVLLQKNEVKQYSNNDNNNVLQIEVKITSDLGCDIKTISDKEVLLNFLNNITSR